MHCTVPIWCTTLPNWGKALSVIPAGWTQKGKKDWGRVVTDKAHEILKTHEPAPLHADVRKTLEEIRSKAEATLEYKDFGA